MDLASWLIKIQALHPAEIELGLERVRRVAERMKLTRPAPWVITVAGTNGKGSCVAMLAAILQAAGYRTGTYTSPHIHRYNERLTLAGKEIDAASLCKAFELIESSLAADSLTYFEFGTLAALLLMQQSELQIAILEVGMGGRLDAVNIVDADISIISQIGLDHMEWLGKDRESIGFEKAGICRPGKPVVCGDIDAPTSVLNRVRELSAPYFQLGKQFNFQQTAAGTWDWQGLGQDGADLHYPRLPLPPLDLCNAAIVLQALALLPLSIPRAAVERGLSGVKLPGRWEFLHDARRQRQVLLDVAHNPSAGALLCEKLHTLKKAFNAPGKILAVLAMMADKDIKGFVRSLESVVDIWYIGTVDLPRALSAKALAELVDECHFVRFTQTFVNPEAAYEKACESAQQNDLILVTGSFLTVAAVRQKLEHEALDIAVV